MKRLLLAASAAALALGLALPAAAQQLTVPPGPALPYTNFQRLPSASGNYTVRPNVPQVNVCLVGAGGGGGGTITTTGAAAGGQSGEFKCALYTVTPGGTVAYTNSTAGGAGGAAGAVGAVGGNVAFGTLTATGGAAGAGSASGNATAQTNLNIIPDAATSGVEVTSEFFGSGAAGTVGLGGRGGNSPWETGGASGVAGAGGNAPTGTGQCGGGGGGAQQTGAGGGFVGGNGGPSCIAVWSP